MQNVATIVPATDPDPAPLTRRAKPVPFPVDALPEPLAEMVTAVAEATQTDPAMAGVSVLSALSAAACGRAEILARPGWREILALQTATVARPGERKSAVQAMIFAPLIDAEEAMAHRGAAARLEAETQKVIADKAAEAARSAAGKATSADRDKLLADAIGAAQFSEAVTVPAIPRLLADDATPEAVGSLLAEQGGRLAIVSAEGGVFDMIAGRYNSGIPNLDVYLKGHSGDPLRVDRRGRPPEYIRRPALTIALMIQPSVLASIGKQPSFRGRGLLARFLYATPVSKVGRRRAGAAPVSDETSKAYADLMTGLVNDLAGWTDPAILRFAHEAHERLVWAEETIEPQLGEDGELGSLADWGSKFLGAVLRITALLHLADLGADRAIRTPIPATTLVRGMQFGAYLKAQAISAFGEMHTDQATADAIYLLDRIASLGESVVSVRDMQRAAQRLKARADLEAPVERLVDAGWLFPLDEPHTGPGRPPSPSFRVHPMTLTQLTQLTEPTA